MGAAWQRTRSGSVVATACGPIQYVSRGAGQPVLAVHGAAGGFDQGIALTQPLIERGLRIIAPSRFGYLQTPLPADASPAAQADAYAALLDALGVERAVVIGASAGAPSCLHLALRHPERCAGLILVVPLAFAPNSTVHLSLAARLWLHAGLLSDFIFWFAVEHATNLVAPAVLATPRDVLTTLSAQEYAGLKRFLRLMLPVRARRAGLRNDAAVATSLDRCALEHIAAPTLVLTGRDDGFCLHAGARYTAAHIPGARLLSFEKGGHMLAGHRSEVLGEIEDFVRRAFARPRARAGIHS